MKLPKLSYVLLSHNREKYIRGALKSAFEQMYDGELEYIISDDCSTDKTFKIINECVAAYKGGRRVIVTQTPYNMNLAGNTNHALQYVTGDYVVRADDDDLSTKDRCMLVGQVIAEHPGCSWVVTKQKRFTNSEEPDIWREYEIIKKKNSSVVMFDVTSGFSGYSDLLEGNVSGKVWRTDVYRSFKALPIDAYWIDDIICKYRACVLGSCAYIPEVTVLTRVGIENMSGVGCNTSASFISIVNNEKFNDAYMNVTYEPLKNTISEIKDYMQRYRPKEFSLAVPFFETVEAEILKRRLLKMYWRKGVINRMKVRHQMGWTGVFSLIRCLPLPIFALLLAICRNLKIWVFRQKKSEE